MSDRQEEVLRERIDATRARVGQTIEQIGDRVNPDRVKADLKARAREEMTEMKNTVKRKAGNAMEGVADAGRGILATIRDNPVPAGMIGVGVAWLIANRRGGHEYRGDESGRLSSRAGQYRPEYGEPSYGASYTRASRIEAAYGDDELKSEAIWRGTDESDGGIREKTSHVMHEATDRVSEVADRAKDRARRIEHRVESSAHDNPMAAGMIALALGIAAGLMIPESDRERRVLGGARERVMDRAQDAVRGASDRLHEATRDAAGETARNMVDGIWPDGSESSSRGYAEPGRM